MGKIHDVKIKPMITHADDRGYLREIVRDDEDLLRQFGQLTVTKTHPGVIKAFHWHKKQDDVWYIADGMARIVMYDQREDSPTHGETQVVVAGEDNPLTILIPAGVAHGYQVLGHKPVILLYAVTHPYDPNNPDEYRIPWDDENIGFDWSIQNR